MHARMPGHFLPSDDTHVSVALDRQQAFIFPL
jgi:iron(III) transport system ATP-binding protein